MQAFSSFSFSHVLTQLKIPDLYLEGRHGWKRIRVRVLGSLITVLHPTATFNPNKCMIWALKGYTSRFFLSIAHFTILFTSKLSSQLASISNFMPLSTFLSSFLCTCCQLISIHDKMIPLPNACGQARGWLNFILFCFGILNN